jgi:hypothetical protein
MTPLEIARAWWSVKDEWIVRRNKMHDHKQWEVVHAWGGKLISEETQKIVGRHETEEAAERKAERLEDSARGAAVLACLATDGAQQDG